MGYDREKDFDMAIIGQYLYDVAYLLSEITTWEDLDAYIRRDSNQPDIAGTMNIVDLKQQYDDVNEAVDSILWNYCCCNIAQYWANSKGVKLPS